MKVAVIGSREFENMDVVEGHIYNYSLLDDFDGFISGGARGVDKKVEEFSKRYNIPMEVIRPVNPANKLDYLYRNVEIITKADIVLAFWDKKSRGSMFVIKYALARGKNIIVIAPDGKVINHTELRGLL